MKKKFILLMTLLLFMGFITAFFIKSMEGYQSNKTNITTDASQNLQKTRTDIVYKSEPPLSSVDKNVIDKIENQEQASISTNSKTSNDTQKNLTVDTKKEEQKEEQKKEEKKEVKKEQKKEVTNSGEQNSGKKDTNVEANKDEKTDSKKQTKRQIDPKKPMIALTFDDGPHYEYTKNILDSLKKYNGVATFFVVGNRAEKNKNIIKRIVAEGNQIGNHTYDHKQLTKLKSNDITDEINKTSKIIQNITNISPSILRPTYGSINDNVKQYSDLPLILWSIDTLDWKNRDKNKIVNAALKKVKSGDVILMHDIYKTTALAADEIIKELSSRGYQLVTISELYEAKGKELVKGHVYSKAY